MKQPLIFICAIVLALVYTACGTKNTNTNTYNIKPCTQLDSIVLQYQSRCMQTGTLNKLDAADINWDEKKYQKSMLTREEKQTLLGNLDVKFEEENIYFYHIQPHRNNTVTITYFENLYEYAIKLTTIVYNCDGKPLNHAVTSVALADGGMAMYCKTIFTNDSIWVRYHVNEEFSDIMDTGDKNKWYYTDEKDSSVTTLLLDAVKGFVKTDSSHVHTLDTLVEENE